MDNMMDIKDFKADLSDIKIENLLDLSKTDAAPLFEGKTYPFEILPEIKGYITDVLIPSLDKAEFEQRGENVFVAKSAKIAASAVINGPTVIFPDAEIRPGAFIRGSAVVGRAAVVGNSTELKNCVLFDGVQVPHYNYVGDAVLGFKAHMGAGAVTANIKADKSNVIIRGGLDIDTGLRKMGAVLGDFADVGCNSVLTPGVIIGRNTNLYPLSMVRGVVPANSVYKSGGKIAKKR